MKQPSYQQSLHICTKQLSASYTDEGKKKFRTESLGVCQPKPEQQDQKPIP